MQTNGTRSRHMDWSIPGDEQENQRIQLEQEMMSRVAHLAFDNTSTHSTESSVEYPRHREPHDGPYSPHADAFPSFSMHEPDDLSQLVQDDNEHIEPNLRSFQHTADDSAMNTGETLSTAYHHASAITLGAGLGGGAFGRTPSRTGFSEFDPDRPLPNFPVKGGVKIALGEPTIMDQSTQHAKQTRQTNISSLLTVDPIIVEDTEELERALESGYLDISQGIKSKQTNTRHPPTTNVRPSSDPEEESSSSSQHSDSGSSTGSRAPRPKLSETLQTGRNGAFSPKRPRVAANIQRPAVVVPRTHENNSDRGANANRFTQARREIERDNKRSMKRNEKYQNIPIPKSSSAPSSIRAPLSDIRNHLSASSHRANNTNGSVHLPDLTGLTSAVDTPIKSTRRYKQVKNGVIDATIVQSNIEELAHRIRELEKENINSRRHVRELEEDLEKCREDVVRERNRVQAEIQKQLQRAQNLASASDRKGKGRADAVDSKAQPVKALSAEELRRWESRYRDVVDTKRELETLVMNLRQQLAQMSSELDMYKQAVDELRALREEDEAEIERRGQEVEELRTEVDRLGSEVIRLRDIIEDSVRERREVSQQHEDFEEAEQHDEAQEQVQERGEQARFDMPKVIVTALSPVPEESFQESKLLDPVEFPGYARPVSRASDANMRARHDRGSLSADEMEFKTRATVGSSGRTAKRFITAAELGRIESDVEERRSFCSGQTSANLDDSLYHPEPQQRSPSLSSRPSQQQQPSQSQFRPVPKVTVTGDEVPRKTSRVQAAKAYRPDPFPAIRGARMEKLFFSLPDHNEMTCHVCRKRRANDRDPLGQNMDGDFQATRGCKQQDDKDLPNTSEVLSAAVTALARTKAKRGVGGERGGSAQELGNSELPPQTVVARALRDLEDDFTHYKSIYLELAEQYGSMDPATNVLKRNVLAEHLKQIVDLLEVKGDQIAALYELLTFKESKIPSTAASSTPLIPDVASTKAARRERLRLWSENHDARRRT